MNRTWWMGILAGLAVAAGPRADEKLADQGLRQIEAIEAAFRRAIEKAQPSVVSIFLVDGMSAPMTMGPGGPRILRGDPTDPDTPYFNPSGFGSGVVIDRRGLILTCYHVVQPVIVNARNHQILVRLSDGRRAIGRVYAADPRSDLAVIELLGEYATLVHGSAAPPQNQKFDLPPIAIADGSKLFRGQFVLAIGNPYGMAAPDGGTSASWGIVANIRRRPEATGSVVEDDRVYLRGRTLVQTDARLNMGISGGALINTKGELVGITMALSAATGFDTPGGFALPTDELTRRIVETLRQGKEVEYGFLGVTLGPAVAVEGATPGAIGARVDGILNLPTTARSGLMPQDVITSVNGKPVKTPADLILEVGSLPVGTVLDMAVLRGQSRLNLKIELAKYPVRGEIVVTNKRPAWNGIRVDHLSVLAAGISVNVGFGRNEFPAHGIVVTEVEPGSLAYELGVRKGQIVTEVNGTRVDKPDQFEQLVQKAKLPVRLGIPGPAGELVIDVPKPKTKSSK